MDVGAIIAALEANIDVDYCVEHQELLQTLLIHTRSSKDDDLRSLFTRRGVQVLSNYALDSHKPGYHIALRCLSNILVRSVATRQLFVEENCLEKVINLMKIGNLEDELATANLLIHSSVQTTLDLTASFEQHDLAGIVNRNISRHARRSTITSNDPSSAIASIRLLSTLAIQYEAHAHLFIPSIPPILDMLISAVIPSPPLQPPLSLLVSCLASIPLQQASSFPDLAVDKLIHMLHLAIQGPTLSQRELLPLFMLLVRLAQSQLSQTRQRLCSHLLPSNTDRNEPLGRGTSLPHQVLKLSGTSVEAELRELILLVFFELSDRDPAQFVRHVGYGNAAGFMAAKGVHLPQDAMEAAEVDSNEYDLVTGQRYESMTQSPPPVMSAEEKEREAERLFILFQRLQSTGVVNVEHPVAQMQRTGQLEELPDDSSE